MIDNNLILHLLHLLSVLHLTSFASAHPHNTHQSAADFVIVGAGTAGCALATRLCTLNPSKSVLLVERSSPRNASLDLLVRSPRFIFEAVTNPHLSETFLSSPQASLAGAPRLPLWAGNTLGGSSSINGMQWLLPLAGTLDHWRLFNLSTATARRFYSRALRTVGFSKPGRPFRHIHLGSLLAAARKAGYGPDRGPLDDSPRRNMYPNRIAVTPDTGRRVDSCTAYLRVASTRCRRNLRVMHGATVARVVLDKRRRAVGVRVVATKRPRGRRVFVRARAEVVLCAGPFHSPRLLQVSGIGPRDWLRAAGVPVRVDLPVGKRAQARPLTGLHVEYTARRDPVNNLALVYGAAARARFQQGKVSVLGKAYGLVNGRDGRRAYLSGSAVDLPPRGDRKLLNPTCVSNVVSTGTVRLASKNPFDPPIVDLGLLDKAEDVARTQQCLRGLLRVVDNLPPSLGASLVDPANRNISEAWVRKSAGWSAHFVAGCAVGSVLTSRLKVKQTKGLRVVDASAIPQMPMSAGPMASVYMLAEYASEVMTKEHEE